MLARKFTPSRERLTVPPWFALAEQRVLNPRAVHVSVASTDCRGGVVSVGVLIEHHARPGCRDEVHAVWDRLLRPAIENDDGHEEYSYLFDADDPDIIRAFQLYRDGEAAAAFVTTPAYAAYVAAVENLLVGTPRVQRCEVIWTKPTPSRNVRPLTTTAVFETDKTGAALDQGSAGSTIPLGYGGSATPGNVHQR